MTYNVRDWVQSVKGEVRATSSPGKTVHTRDRGREESLVDVLAVQAVKMREKYPEAFAKADAIKANPDRKVHGLSLQGTRVEMHDDTLYERYKRECEWCGDPFILDKLTKQTKCCSTYCGGQLRQYKRRRMMKETTMRKSGAVVNRKIDNFLKRKSEPNPNTQWESARRRAGLEQAS